MRPTDAFAEVAKLLVRIVGKSYREEPMTDLEWDQWTDDILMLAQREKDKWLVSMNLSKGEETK